MRGRHILILTSVLAVVAAGGVGGWWWTHRDTSQTKTDPAPQVTGKPTKIGPEGGTVQTGDVTIVIPAGAVPGSTSVTVLRSGSRRPIPGRT